MPRKVNVDGGPSGFFVDEVVAETPDFEPCSDPDCSDCRQVIERLALKVHVKSLQDTLRDTIRALELSQMEAAETGRRNRELADINHRLKDEVLDLGGNPDEDYDDDEEEVP